MNSWCQQTLIEKIRWTDSLHSIKTTTDGRTFVAGQFTKLGFKRAASDTPLSRAYSYVNAPQQDFLEFYYTLVPDGTASHYLEQLVVGEQLLVSEQSQGFMVLDELPKDDCYTNLWLLATGTGVGPFISILRNHEVWQRFASVVLVHAVRHNTELAYHAEVVQLQQTHAQLRYVPIVSREAPTVNTQLIGRIPQLISTGALEQQAHCRLQAASSQVMICGNPAMIKDTSALLQERGLRKHRRSSPGNITTEQYWVER